MVSYLARKYPANCLKLKERFGLFSLAVIFSFILFAMIFVFTNAFFHLFFSSIVEDKKPGIIWVENMVETSVTGKKLNSYKQPSSAAADFPQG
jgi:hypothetical protein